MNDIMSELHPALPPGPFDLRELLEHEPPITWRPKKDGEFVIGVVLREFEGSRGNYTYPIIELMNSKGRLVRVRASAKTLRSKLEELGVKPGMLIKITLVGLRESRAGYEYRLFDVKVV